MSITDLTVWYFYEHLTTSYACLIDIYGLILNGSLFSLLFSGFFIRLWVCALCRFCVFLCGSWRFLWDLWLSVAYLWFFVAFHVAFYGFATFCVVFYFSTRKLKTKS